MERIHVTVRARPLSPEDAKTSPWRISGNSISISNHYSKFEFDQVFAEDRKTVEVYQDRIKDIVTAAVGGFNGTVFAYGQTNSGKTHTMRGSPTEPGVIPLAIHDLFDIIQEDMDREFLLRMSYMEIYNEEINDLLAPEHRKLQIHENFERGIYVAGLREEIVASSEQVLNLMEYGESHRHIGETNMNLHSSRSHTIFRMIIESRNKTEGEDVSGSCDAVRVSVLNLVDLAGSERAAKTGAEGVRLKEGSHINKSLMTLGTVIKKLSEGAESQGGHVPYRDSKLTRILQPALGGNANTAIICNITLAQIHVDETKSSLQFASKALRVTNCAHVNEILTDAALLKRQKKEIEELRAKLQGSHSEHFEEEILNLRNTLLQTELERERIALELEEEKKAQAEREKRLQEQAKKIENLSSMVLYSNRDEIRDNYKKGKRRDTWCPGNLLRETIQEECSSVHSKPSSPTKPKRDMGPLRDFEELLSESEFEVDVSSKQQEEFSSNIAVEDCALPDPRALVHVTNRRKVPTTKKSSVENDELAEMHAEYEDLLLTSETQRIVGEIQIDCLTKKLTEANFFLDVGYDDHTEHHPDKITDHRDKEKCSRDSEAIIVIKQLQDKINTLEMEKHSSQKNLDHIAELATEQNICAREKYEELYEDYLKALEKARVNHEQFSFRESLRTIEDGNLDFMGKLLIEVQHIVSEVQNSRNLADSVSLILDELFQSFSAMLSFFLDLKSMTSQDFVQVKSILNDHEKLHLCMQEKVTLLENDKLLLQNQSIDLHRQMEEIRLDAQKFEQALSELSEHHDLEKSELFSQIEMLDKEISCLSTCAVAKEKDNLRRDLEKTKVKLKETESKLKNAIHEKTKLEGEKACAEREVKQLHSQRMLLERNISKRDSLAGRRRDSFVEKSLKACDLKKAGGHAIAFEQTVEGENKKLEVLLFEMEATIASLEDELAAACEAKEEAICRNEVLASELVALAEKLNIASSELNVLQEEVSGLQVRLEESESRNQKREISINLLGEEKEELAMQLTNALLEMEEEKAVWSAKEKASVEAFKEKAKSYNAEMALLSKELLEVKDELESCRKECKVFEERLIYSEENSARESKHSLEKSLEIDSLRNDLQIADVESKRSQENFKNQLLSLRKERDKLVVQIEQQGHVTDVENLKKNHENELLEAKLQVEEMTKRIFKVESTMQNVEASNSIERAKLRMRLHWTQLKLDAFRGRHKEALDELDYMHKKYEEASRALKDRLVSYGNEVLNLKKQLASIDAE